MKGLLLRLSALDADAENTVRVISFFDELITGRATLATLLRETARLAECPAGVMDAASDVSLRSDAQGRVVAGSPPQDTAVIRDLSPTSRVWLERLGEPLPLDAIVLERFAIAAAPLLDHPRAPLPQLSDAALLELALSESAGQPERARAVRLMGFESTTPLHVLAVAADATQIARLLAALRDAGASTRGASFGRVHAVLTPSLPTAVTEQLPLDVCIGVGPALPALDAPTSWWQARTALRLTRLGSPRATVVHADQLGALASIAARLRTEDIAEVADVTALDRLAEEPHGEDTLSVLGAFCATGSARKAAAEVYRHHSTVAARLAHAESRLGFSFTGTGGRLRLELALVLRHLRDSDTAD